jgi:DinB superfamily
MTQQVGLELFKAELFKCLEETFESTHGIYLDRGTSLFETLEGVSAEEASRASGKNCATLAAQVDHVAFYLDVLVDVMKNEKVEKVNWREIWENVREVTPERWEEQKQKLRQSHQQVLDTLKNYDKWETEYGIAGALAILTHTAYHLGGLRQALCAIRSTTNA